MTPWLQNRWGTITDGLMTLAMTAKDEVKSNQSTSQVELRFLVLISTISFKSLAKLHFLSVGRITAQRWVNSGCLLGLKALAKKMLRVKLNSSVGDPTTCKIWKERNFWPWKFHFFFNAYLGHVDDFQINPRLPESQDFFLYLYADCDADSVRNFCTSWNSWLRAFLYITFSIWIFIPKV